MKNKLEQLSKGFVMYKIKQHIEYLHDRQRKINDSHISQEYNSKVTKEEIKPFTHSTSISPNFNQKNDLQAQRQELYQHLRSVMGDEISISMNGIPMKTYLVEIEKKLGKPLTTL